MLGAKFNI
jgi:ankyrin repeat protein